MTTQALVKMAVKQGWRVKEGKHIMLFAPDGVNKVTLSRTPRRPGNECARGELRRAGLVGV